MTIDLFKPRPQLPPISPHGIQRPVPHGKQPNTPPTIYVIRHGEKNTTEKNNGPDDNSLIGLNIPGNARANTLPVVFNVDNTNPYGIRLILAMQPQPDGQQERPFQTILPLFQSLLMTKDDYCLLDNTVLKTDVDRAAKRIADFITSGGSGNVLLCWEHKRLKDILEAFGFKGAPVYPELFDVVWELKPVPYKDPSGCDDGLKWTWNKIVWSTEGTMADIPLIDDREKWIEKAGAPSDLVTHSKGSGPVIVWPPPAKHSAHHHKE